MVKIKKEQINNKQNVWIEIIAVLFIVGILSINFSDFEKINLAPFFKNISFGSIDVEDNMASYLANVSGGLNVVKEDLNKINFDIIYAGTKSFSFFESEFMDRVQNIGNVYNKGITTIREGSSNYANVFYSNLTNNLGVIDRQLHTAKTNFCK